MEQFAQNAGGLAAACTILGLAFLWFFQTRHLTHGDSKHAYSPTMAGFVQLLFVAMPWILLASYTGDGFTWTIPETASASLVTAVILRWHVRTARRAFFARIAKQKKAT